MRILWPLPCSSTCQIEKNNVSKQLAVSENSNRQVTEKNQTVLIPVDGSSGSKRSLEWASKFLNFKYTQVHLLHIYNYAPITGQREPSVQEGSRILEEARSFLLSRNIQVTGCCEKEGTPSDAIRTYADEHEIALIIIGTHDVPKWTKYLTGSISQHVFEHAQQVVILVNKSSLFISHADKKSFMHFLQVDEHKSYKYKSVVKNSAI